MSQSEPPNPAVTPNPFGVGFGGGGVPIWGQRGDGGLQGGSGGTTEGFNWGAFFGGGVFFP